MALQRTGRVEVYTNQVPYESDILRTNMYKMADIATLAQTLLGVGTGNSTKVQGGACTATGPASLAVNIAPITIYQEEDYDATDYGVIPADTDNVLYKQGVNLDTTLISGFTAPGSPGTNYYLIQATLQTTDTNSVSRPYYNVDDPSVPIFTSQPDTRVDSVAISKKVSSSSTPSPDAGNVGLYAITVAFGQSTITSGDITVYSTTEGAPFITEGLTQKLSQTTADLRYVTKANEQNGTFVYAAAAGSANAITATYSPAIASQPAGQGIRLKATATNTGSTTITVNGLSANTIKKNTYAGLVSLSGGEIVSGGIYFLVFNGTNYELLNPTIGASSYLPTGMFFDHGAATPPAGALVRDGSAVSRTTYANLFSIIGTTWGIGDGSTTFNLPDSRRASTVGSGGSGTVELPNTVGSSGGDETSSDLINHTHGFTASANDFYGSSGAPATGPGTSGSPFGLFTKAPTGTTQTAGTGSSFNLYHPVIVALPCIKT